MTEYERSIDIRRSAEEVFEFVEDIQRLPDYFPQITSVQQLEEDKIRTTAHIEPPGQPARDVQGEAWFRVRTAGQSLEWGSVGPNNYKGELDVDPKDSSSCTLTVRIITDNGDPDSVRDGLEKAVHGIADHLQRR